MAIQQELWLDTIVDNLFADDSFLIKSVDLSAFVNGKTCHIPNAGATPGVSKNRSTLPSTVTKRTDTDGTFNINEFTTDPILIPKSDEIQLSYDKRSSVVRGSQGKLRNAVAEDILYGWLTGVAVDIPTTGGPTAITSPAHTPSATGTRKAMSRAEVLSVSTKMNQDDIPSTDRYMLLDAVMYNQLLSDMTEADKLMLVASANSQKGIIGQLYGINLMMRSRVAVAAVATLKDWAVAGAATDNAIGVAWHQDSVCRAMGDHKAFANEDDATYYGSICSFLILAGGSQFRGDKKGIYRIIQAA